jgi:hypothetical protein
MLESVKNESVLFLDIETIPDKPDFEQADPVLKELWEKKSAYFRKEDESAADVYKRAGIYSEFGRIICISVGILLYKEAKQYFRVKSFAGDNEKEILQQFCQALTKFNKNNDIFLCAHNGKEFDFPYIARRMLINGIKLPAVLDVAGKKPWEVNFLDTMELWKFGDYKHFTSLNLLSHIFNIPSPKGDIDGSMVADVYWKESDIDRIVRYCERDVITVARLFLRFKGGEDIADDVIEYAGSENA